MKGRGNWADSPPKHNEVSTRGKIPDSKFENGKKHRVCNECPTEGGTLAPYRGDDCPHFDHWKYGPIHALAYLTLDADHTWPQIESEYAQRDVIYLLGTADTDPHEKDLDVSCSAEAQGPNRLARGQAYYIYLHGRHPSGWSPQLWLVPGVAHSAHRMFTSICGVAALFDAGTCPDHKGGE